MSSPSTCRSSPPGQPSPRPTSTTSLATASCSSATVAGVDSSAARSVASESFALARRQLGEADGGVARLGGGCDGEAAWPGRATAMLRSGSPHPHPPCGAARRREGGSTAVPDALLTSLREPASVQLQPFLSGKAMCCLESNPLYLILHDIFQLS